MKSKKYLLLQILFFISILIYKLFDIYSDRNEIFELKTYGIVNDIFYNEKNELSIKCINSKGFFSVGKHNSIQKGDSIYKASNSWMIKWYRKDSLIKIFEMGEGD